MIFVLVQSILAHRQQNNLYKLYQLGVAQTLCSQWQIVFILLQSIVLFGLMLTCGLALLKNMSLLDSITGLGYGLFLVWLCVRYFHSAAVLKVVKQGALYL